MRLYQSEEEEEEEEEDKEEEEEDKEEEYCQGSGTKIPGGLNYT